MWIGVWRRCGCGYERVRVGGMGRGGGLCASDGLSKEVFRRVGWVGFGFGVC